MLSIIIPVYNSSNVILKLTEEIIKIFEKYKIEIILVNDCSLDNSHDECMNIVERYPDYISYIKFSKNFGEHNAVMAGLKYSRGEWIIIMDDDFQNPPQEALKLYEFSIINNFDVVYCDYEAKYHSILRNFFSKINDLSSRIILEKPKNIYLSSFKSINRKTVNKIIVYDGPFPYIDGLIFDTTSNFGSIKIKHKPRELGRSGYNLRKLLKLYSNLIINFSTKPIHFCSLLGIFIVTVSGFLGIKIIIEKLLDPLMPLGYTSIFVAIIFFSGVQLIFLGLLGEYIGKILKNVNKSNQYSIDYLKLVKKKNI